MKSLLYALFLAVFSVGFLERYQLMPARSVVLIDLLAGLLGLFVVLYLARNKTLRVGPFYVVVFLLLVVHMVIGAIAAGVSAGALVSGARAYFKYVPLFLLPLVYPFSDKEIRRLLVFFLVVALAQLPIAIYQRMVEGAVMLTGDVVRGTMETSSILSVFLISTSAVAFAFFLRGRLSKLAFGLILLILFVPVTLNETKASVVLLPVAMGIAFVAARPGRLGFGSFVALFLGVGVLLSAFAAVYSTYFDAERLTFLTDGDVFMRMMAPQTTGVAGSEEQIGRVDVAVAPFLELSEDPLDLIMGLGLGNVTKSVLGSAFDGEYVEEYGNLKFISVANVIWELGLIGCLLIVALIAKVLQDAWSLRHRDDLVGSLASGWSAAVAIFLISLFYKDVLFFDSLAFSFMFFSGIIASERALSRYPAPATAAPATAAPASAPPVAATAPPAAGRVPVRVSRRLAPR